MDIKKIKAINIVLFLYEIYKALYWVYLDVYRLMDEKLVKLIDILYAPLLGFYVMPDVVYLATMATVTYLFIYEGYVCWKWQKYGLSKAFCNLIKFFALFSLLSTIWWGLITIFGNM